MPGAAPLGSCQAVIGQDEAPRGVCDGARWAEAALSIALEGRRMQRRLQAGVGLLCLREWLDADVHEWIDADAELIEG
jgi:hypothetical protein